MKGAWMIPALLLLAGCFVLLLLLLLRRERAFDAQRPRS